MIPISDNLAYVASQIREIDTNVELAVRADYSLDFKLFRLLDVSQHILDGLNLDIQSERLPEHYVPFINFAKSLLDEGRAKVSEICLVNGGV